jgi:phytanoyl-CoA dioxygenase PhyH
MDWIVTVSREERATASLHATTAAAAHTALRRHGCLLLRGALEEALVATMQDEFLAQYGALDGAGMLAQSAKPPPNAVLKVGDARYEIAPRMRGAFGNPGVFANPLLCRFLVAELSNTMRLSGFTVVVSYPGAGLQHIHRDHTHLFAEPGISRNLPPYAINVAVPLIDVDALTGPTGVWPGSHLWPEGPMPAADTITTVALQRGDCLLLDYRTLHTGLPNGGDLVRPIAYMVYARTWFFDEINHTVRPSLDMTLEDYEALPKPVQSLLMRAFAQNMRARYLNAPRDS